MKGEQTITVTIKDETRAFPLTSTYTIKSDNTYEHIDEWKDVFKKILYLIGFHPDTVEEAIPYDG